MKKTILSLVVLFCTVTSVNAQQLLKGDMNDTLEGIAETDSVTKQVVMQQILLLDTLHGQLSGIADTISVSLKALDESSKQTLMAEIMKRCSDIKAAAKELE